LRLKGFGVQALLLDAFDVGPDDLLLAVLADGCVASLAAARACTPYESFLCLSILLVTLSVSLIAVSDVTSVGPAPWLAVLFSCHH
jgi:hypothetical protein